MSAKILNFISRRVCTERGNVIYLTKVSATDMETVNAFIEGVQAFVARRSPSGRKAVLVSRDRFPIKVGEIATAEKS